MVTVRRLGADDVALARATFAMMGEVFEEPVGTLSDAYLRALLIPPTFWAFVALEDGEPVGGVTAHTLMMTRSESREVFIYDLAVRADRQRRGIGRQLVRTLKAAAAAEGIALSFVPADDEDTHALAFYEALGGEAAPVTIFTFEADSVTAAGNAGRGAGHG
ncbi:MAG: GNAT family N-acetyltransferase [Gemmatimonadaceae bacterium]|nr:GNAT family N-acetyltransferase [Gemmatimonadaceae bacterium]